jgi:hypothetical protein
MSIPCISHPQLCARAQDATPCNCTTVVCDKRHGGDCRNVTAPDGSRCVASKCRCNMFCFQGQCVGGEAIDCPQYPLPCKRYQCVETTGKCTAVVNVPDGTLCPDGTCSNGVCRQIVCPPPPNTCNAYVYNVTAKNCSLVPTNNGRSCSDGNRCTGMWVVHLCMSKAAT